MVATLALTLLMRLQTPQVPLYEGLGGFHRTITTASAQAQRYFDQGLAFMYAFNHDEAIRAFRQAAQIDPGCAMAQWGIATANGPHINNPMVDPAHAKAGYDAITAARKLYGSATPVEKALVRAARVRFASDPEADRSTLDRAYATAMKSVWRRHPKDPDVGALYAESLMDLRPWDLWKPDGTPQPGTPEIVRTLEAVLKIAPLHPLANHLYIHAMEASPNPGKADLAADNLRSLQPFLGHMVHMPSHIDVRRGRWRSAVIANEKAIAADAAYAEKQPNQGFYRLYMGHNFHMLTFAAMMRGQAVLAIKTIDDGIARIPADWAKENSAIADGFMAMPLEVRKRFGRWDEILAAPEPPEWFPIARAMYHCTKGMAFAAINKATEAREEMSNFLAARRKVDPTAGFGNNSAHALLEVAQYLLAGEILITEGKPDLAIASLKQAVAAEDQLRYDEPPDWIQPSRHTLGALLVREKRFADAESVYREDLKRLPGNGWSLYGLSKALEGQGKRDEARRIREKFDQMWVDADMPITSSCMCLPG